ncbi:hypothetical protein CEUSTIGMA_g3337.t1 [Chlamydomonas eustigma]|uniref:Uncharacterized protein n=1 Tax=Chlamydomonas eustigma TaxID=1157962 RepID=A0A250WYH2_9CHLO|nr:hypothetical protein CEUSTIGMA_g3337.t1 [Chlamydomonas eustigma]|eukprot:GAX75894.1 hypothetical protein CEUSTIGMA_g3337.t1 [Chlamydomonas eustigma]
MLRTGGMPCQDGCLEAPTISHDPMIHYSEAIVSLPSSVVNNLPRLLSMRSSVADVADTSQLPELVSCREDSFDDGEVQGACGGGGDFECQRNDSLLGSTPSYTGPTFSPPPEGLSTPAVQPAPMHPPPCLRQDMRRWLRGVGQPSHDMIAGSGNPSNSRELAADDHPVASMGLERTQEHMQATQGGRDATFSPDLWEEEEEDCDEDSLPDLAGSSSDSDAHDTLPERDRERLTSVVSAIMPRQERVQRMQGSLPNGLRGGGPPGAVRMPSFTERPGSRSESVTGLGPRFGNVMSDQMRPLLGMRDVRGLPAYIQLSTGSAQTTSSVDSEEAEVLPSHDVPKWALRFAPKPEDMSLTHASAQQHVNGSSIPPPRTTSIPPTATSIPSIATSRMAGSSSHESEQHHNASLSPAHLVQSQTALWPADFSAELPELRECSDDELLAMREGSENELPELRDEDSDDEMPELRGSSSGSSSSRSLNGVQATRTVNWPRLTPQENARLLAAASAAMTPLAPPPYLPWLEPTAGNTTGRAAEFNINPGFYRSTQRFERENSLSTAPGAQSPGDGMPLFTERQQLHLQRLRRESTAVSAASTILGAELDFMRSSSRTEVHRSIAARGHVHGSAADEYSSADDDDGDSGRDSQSSSEWETASESGFPLLAQQQGGSAEPQRPALPAEGGVSGRSRLVMGLPSPNSLGAVLGMSTMMQPHSGEAASLFLPSRTHQLQQADSVGSQGSLHINRPVQRPRQHGTQSRSPFPASFEVQRSRDGSGFRVLADTLPVQSGAGASPSPAHPGRAGVAATPLQSRGIGASGSPGSGLFQTPTVSTSNMGGGRVAPPWQQDGGTEAVVTVGAFSMGGRTPHWAEAAWWREVSDHWKRHGYSPPEEEVRKLRGGPPSAAGPERKPLVLSRRHLTLPALAAFTTGGRSHVLAVLRQKLPVDCNASCVKETLTYLSTVAQRK